MSSESEKVALLLESGMNQNAIARELGIAKSTVAYHARNLGKPAAERCNRRYDWDAVQRYYDEGHSDFAGRNKRRRDEFGAAARSEAA